MNHIIPSVITIITESVEVVLAVLRGRLRDVESLVSLY